jgi:hypothetical protein
MLDMVKTEGELKLLELAGILDHATNYDQRIAFHPNGDPACAIGHWAFHHKDRWFCVLTKDHNSVALKEVIPEGPSVEALSVDDLGSYSLYSILWEFEIRCLDGKILFGESGCGDAGNDPKKAAAFIREFVHQSALRRMA